jgi:hypothetical protein
MRVLNKELNKSNTGLVYPLDIYVYFQKGEEEIDVAGNGQRGHIFIRVQPFYEQALSNLDRSMHRSLWV